MMLFKNKNALNKINILHKSNKKLVINFIFWYYREIKKMIF
ncbi:MAG: hypothetical protein CNLJKLNK_00200 [Holosporales bacterium]